MKNLYKVLILTLSVFPGLCSCSLTGEENDNPASELTIEVDNPLISADGESCAKLTVKLGGKDVTSEVTFYDAAKNVPVNLPDAKFSTTTPGKYSFWASYKAYISSSISVVAISAKVPEVPADPQPESLALLLPVRDGKTRWKTRLKMVDKSIGCVLYCATV